MSNPLAVGQAANVLPARRGAVVAIETDATARAYDLTGLSLGGNYSAVAAQDVYLTLRAVTAACWYHFSSTNDADLDDTAKVAAGDPLAFANAYGEPIPAGQAVQVRIRRNVDKYLVIKTAAGGGVLVVYASSDLSGPSF